MSAQDRIQPFSENPFYWRYKGEPVLLLGGSVEDNLFQIADLGEHLDLLSSVGGNYVRCTMASRHESGMSSGNEGYVWPFAVDLATGLYDLRVPGAEYWARFQRFMELTAARDIVVQFEMWDRFDFAREPWERNPYNPKNNINYTAAESGLKTEILTHPGQCENAVFRSVPALEYNRVVLPYQQAQVDQMLSISLQYGHALYCMDNETNESPEWGWYWSGYIQRRAEEAGVSVETTEMWDAHNLLDGEHAATFDHPEIYSFVDISQNNHLPADEHWDNAQEIRRRLIASGHIRPMNSVKIYGANSGSYGTTRDAQERFWRNILGGLASSRFHRYRPRAPVGLGLNAIAQAHIRSMRLFTEEIDIFRSEPHNDLLANRSWNEAYCTALPGVEYGVFFPDGGNVFLDVSATQQPLTARWLEIRACRWTGPAQPIEREGSGQVRLVTPTEEGYWAVVVKPLEGT